jgi:hypothetical protein
METKVEITINPDTDYFYTIKVMDIELSVSYTEHPRDINQDPRHKIIFFSSLDEMEKVAEAMMKAVKMGRDI